MSFPSYAEVYDQNLVECKGSAKIKSSVDGKIYNIEGADLDWECIYAHEVDPLVITYEGTIVHDELGELTWQCGSASQEPNIGPHELVEDFTSFDYKYSNEFDLKDEPESFCHFTN